MHALPRVFFRSLPDPNPEGRLAVFVAMFWGVLVSSILWVALYLGWRAWGWWGPAAVLAGGSALLVVVALAYGRRRG